MTDESKSLPARLVEPEQAEYAAATAKRLGLPETVEYVGVRTEYGLLEPDGTVWHVADATRKQLEDEFAEPGDVTVAREVITTAWREVTS